MSAFLEKLFKRADARKATAAESWGATVAAICDGKSPAVEETERLMDALGKTPKDLENEVARLQARRAAAAAKKRGEDAAAELHRIEAALSAANRQLDAEIEQARAKFQKTAEPLWARQSECQAAVRAGEA